MALPLPIIPAATLGRAPISAPSLALRPAPAPALSASADAPAAQVAAPLGGGDTNPVLKTLQQLQVADAACGVHGVLLTLQQAMQEAGVSVDVSAGASCS